MRSLMPDAQNTSPELVAATRIAAGDDRTRYDGFAIALHWATALLVVILFGLGQTWDWASRPTRHTMITAHMSLGILLTAIILVRIAWRLMPGHQVSAATSGLVELASKAVHYLLYAMLATQAVLGFVLRWSGNEAMSFFGLANSAADPDRVARDEPSHRRRAQLRRLGDHHHCRRARGRRFVSSLRVARRCAVAHAARRACAADDGARACAGTSR